MQVIHPFPARMAPEIARDAIAKMRPGERLLDPMCGSGVTVRTAVEGGVDAFGTDIDPLAVLMTRVWTTPLDSSRFLHDVQIIVEEARRIRDEEISLSWHDPDTSSFIDYWFAPEQRKDLKALSYLIYKSGVRSREAMMVALSRTIVTKDRGASLARDASHSRPHRVADSNSFDVLKEFVRSSRTLVSRLAAEKINARSTVMRGDCRSLTRLEIGSIDAVVTSPPYLNALDYFRGHRLSLVWLGYGLREIRELRGGSVGTERGAKIISLGLERYVSSSENITLPSRYMGWITRYADDAERLVSEMLRVVRSGGRVVLVVGNSFLRGCVVDNASIFQDLLRERGVEDLQRVERSIPARRRYLPPPGGQSALAFRMRSEVVLSGVAA